MSEQVNSAKKIAELEREAREFLAPGWPDGEKISFDAVVRMMAHFAFNQQVEPVASPTPLPQPHTQDTLESAEPQGLDNGSHPGKLASGTQETE